MGGARGSSAPTRSPSSTVGSVDGVAGADEDDISATYDRGILTVSVPLSDTEPTEKHVEVFEVALDDDDIDDEDMYEDDDEDDKGHPSDEAVDQSEGEDQHRSDDGA